MAFTRGASKMNPTVFSSVLVMLLLLMATNTAASGGQAGAPRRLLQNNDLGKLFCTEQCTPYLCASCSPNPPPMCATCPPITQLTGTVCDPCKNCLCLIWYDQGAVRRWLRSIALFHRTRGTNWIGLKMVLLFPSFMFYYVNVGRVISDVWSSCLNKNSPSAMGAAWFVPNGKSWGSCRLWKPNWMGATGCGAVVLNFIRVSRAHRPWARGGRPGFGHMPGLGLAGYRIAFTTHHHPHIHLFWKRWLNS